MDRDLAWMAGTDMVKGHDDAIWRPGVLYCAGCGSAWTRTWCAAGTAGARARASQGTRHASRNDGGGGSARAASSQQAARWMAAVSKVDAAGHEAVHPGAGGTDSAAVTALRMR